MSSTDNYVIIKSKEEFQSLLSQDLLRISVLNFRADWAEPCKTMDSVARELAQRHPKMLFLQVEAEAEELSEISETFDIESVPHFILLKGHTLLEQVSGVNAAALTKAVEKHSNTKPVTQALSTTNQKPQKAPQTNNANGQNEESDSEEEEETEEFHQDPAPATESDQELIARCNQIMNSAPVMLFMKGNPAIPRCGFSKQTVALLKQEKVNFKTFDILKDESVRQKLKEINEWPTFPQLIIKGEFVGGLDVFKEMITSGEFKEMTSDI